MEVKKNYKKTRPETKQTDNAYSQKINYIVKIRSDLKIYMMQTFGWNGYFGNGSNKYLIPLAYKEAMKDYKKKLRNLQDGKRKLGSKQLKVREVGNLVEEFIGVKIRFWAINKNDYQKQYLGRCILCKYVFENLEKVNGKHIRNYLNPNHKIRTGNPGRWRHQLTQSFTTHPERRELYYNFIEFIKSR